MKQSERVVAGCPGTNASLEASGIGCVRTEYLTDYLPKSKDKAFEHA
jgi:hypothetical protein